MRIGKIALLLVSALLLCFLCGCTSFQKGDTTVLLKIGGQEVTAEMYRFVCMKNKSYLFDDTKAEDLTDLQKEELEQAVLSELRQYCALESMADTYGVKLSKSVRKEIKNQIKESRKNYESDDLYFKDLESRYMSENVFYLQTLNYYLDGELCRFLTDEASGIIRLSDAMLLKDVEEYFYAAVQIYISDTSKTKTAEILRERAQAGEDFFELAKEYSEDNNKGVRYFTVGETYDFFEETVKNLKVGEISSVVKSEMGLHVILRCALEDEYVDKHLEEFRETDLLRIYHEMVQKVAEGLTVDYTKDYAGLILQ